MTTLDVVNPRKKSKPSAEEAAAKELVRMGCSSSWLRVCLRPR